VPPFSWIVGAIPAVDIDKVRELIGLMVENDLLSISVRNGAEEITLRRPDKNASSHPSTGMGGNPFSASGVAVAEKDEPPLADAEPPDDDENLILVKSPMVGTFYSAAHPGGPQFVQVGSAVSANTVVGIIEAMKVFNEIPAEVAGTIAKVLVSNEQAVEFGQPLFAVRPG